MYYLQSRYYDPAIGRFLNADVVYDYDAGPQGFNLFIYCGNNPMSRIDISGADSEGIADGEDMLDEPLLEGGAVGRGSSGSIQTNYGNGRGNFRANLQAKSGQSGEGCHAHHVFPYSLRTRFKSIDINVNNPEYGAWWEASPHLKNSYLYNQIWNCLLDTGITKDEALIVAKILAAFFGYDVYF